MKVNITKLPVDCVSGEGVAVDARLVFWSPQGHHCVLQSLEDKADNVRCVTVKLLPDTPGYNESNDIGEFNLPVGKDVWVTVDSAGGPVDNIPDECMMPEDDEAPASAPAEAPAPAAPPVPEVPPVPDLGAAPAEAPAAASVPPVPDLGATAEADVPDVPLSQPAEAPVATAARRIIGDELAEKAVAIIEAGTSKASLKGLRKVCRADGLDYELDELDRVVTGRGWTRDKYWIYMDVSQAPEAAAVAAPVPAPVEAAPAPAEAPAPVEAVPATALNDVRVEPVAASAEDIAAQYTDDDDQQAMYAEAAYLGHDGYGTKELAEALVLLMQHEVLTQNDCREIFVQVVLGVQLTE